MKTTLKLLIAVCVAGIFFSSCKKKDSTVFQTTLQKLQYKWTFDKEYYHDVYPGTDFRDTTLGVAGDYFDFRTDNKAYLKVGPYMDTSAYYLLGDTKIVFSTFNDTIDIQVLNGTNLQMYNRSDYAPSSYDETTDFLHR